jgi:transposase
VLSTNVWGKLLGVDRQTVIDSVDFDEGAESVVVHVRPRRSTKRRCGICRCRAPGYDQGVGRRNWRPSTSACSSVTSRLTLPG